MSTSVANGSLAVILVREFFRPATAVTKRENSVLVRIEINAANSTASQQQTCPHFALHTWSQAADSRQKGNESRASCLLDCSSEWSRVALPVE